MSIRRLIVYSTFVLFCGCATTTKHEQSALRLFDTGQPHEAIEALNKAAGSRRAECQLIAVDAAVASLMAGEPTACEHSLTAVRKEIDFLRQKDIREQTAAVFSDDKAIAWSGREFEQRMIDNILILSSLLGSRQDAFAFATQADEHLIADLRSLTPQTVDSTADSIEIIATGHSTNIPSLPPPPGNMAANAFTAYLAAAVHSESPMSSDATQAALHEIEFWQPSHQHPVVQTGFGVDSEPGHGILHVITFVGRVGEWQPETSPPTSAALLLADQILSAVGDHTLPPTIAPVRIARPASVASRNPFRTTIQLNNESKPLESRTLVDLNKAAHESYLADRDKQIARAVVRRIVKKGAVYAAKDQLSVSNDSGADMLLSLGGMAWEAMEKPDVRHVRLLPERVEVLQVQLSQGNHEIVLGSTSARGVTQDKTVGVSIDNGRNTFILCFRPQDKICRVTTSR